MKKHLLFTLAGGLILWVWQFLSFGMINFHESGMRYTPLQDTLLQALAQSGLQPGMYVLGHPDPAKMENHEAWEEACKAYEGKPWALVNYHMNNSFAMGMNMIRGLSVCLLIGFILFWLMGQQANPTLQSRILLCMGIGFIIFMFVPYTNFIWFKNPDIMAHLLDCTLPWAILGFVGHKMS